MYLSKGNEQNEIELSNLDFKMKEWKGMKMNEM